MRPSQVESKERYVDLQGDACAGWCFDLRSAIELCSCEATRKNGSTQLSQGIVLEFPYVVLMREPISVGFYPSHEIRSISLTSLRDQLASQPPSFA
jgi:hypothetical protein